MSKEEPFSGTVFSVFREEGREGRGGERVGCEEGGTDGGERNKRREEST